MRQTLVGKMTKPSDSSDLGDLFDASAKLVVKERLRPHWSQAGAIVFVTFRTKDSIPKIVMEQWDREKNDWLFQKGLLSSGEYWANVLPNLSPTVKSEFKKEFHRQKELFLDDCHGMCVLRRPELARIVADSLMYFDGERYRMGDFVVMPNHVHLLAAFSDSDRMNKQFASWLHYSACQINRRLGQKGRFWQQEPFDHLVRSADQYEYLRRYIEENPKKANLKVGEYLHRKY